jgi:hypothetical protein
MLWLFDSSNYAKHHADGAKISFKASKEEKVN